MRRNLGGWRTTGPSTLAPVAALLRASVGMTQRGRHVAGEGEAKPLRLHPPYAGRPALCTRSVKREPRRMVSKNGSTWKKMISSD